MGQSVFISKSSKDDAVAGAVCTALEKSGLSCWIAPRNIPGGTSDWDAEIVRGIRECSVMVLIHTDNANLSRHVVKEVRLACAEGREKHIIPLRLTDSPYSDALDYHLSGSQWVDGMPEDASYSELIKAIRAYIPSAPKQTGISTPKPKPETPPDQPPDLFEKALAEANRLYEEGNYAACLKIVRRFAALGYERAINFLGVLYDNGQGVTQDRAHAFELYTEAAEMGSPPAMCNLGICYENGTGTGIDTEKAFHWYGRAAEAGHTYGQYCYAWAYECGVGTQKNLPQAAEWYRRAAETHHDSQYNLAMLLLFADGLADNDTQALELMRRSAQGKTEQAEKFVAAYDSIIGNFEAIRRETLTDPAPRTSDLYEALHKSLYVQDQSEESRFAAAARFVLHMLPQYAAKPAVQAAYTLLLAAHLDYLYAEAPFDERNLFMVNELFSAGKMEGQSDCDKLYDLLRDKQSDHIALQLYDSFHALTGSYAAETAKGGLERLLPCVGTSEDVFSQLRGLDDCCQLAHLMAYSFCLPEETDEDTWAQWLTDSRADRRALVMYIINLYFDMQERAEKTPLSVKGLPVPVEDSLLSMALQGVRDFYAAFDDDSDTAEEPVVTSETNADSGEIEIDVGDLDPTPQDPVPPKVIPPGLIYKYYLTNSDAVIYQIFNCTPIKQLKEKGFSIKDCPVTAKKLEECVGVLLFVGANRFRESIVAGYALHMQYCKDNGIPILVVYTDDEGTLPITMSFLVDNPSIRVGGKTYTAAEKIAAFFCPELNEEDIF
ncbi:MAG: toll/interleukin-1 receptor domain-containing protein [Oscillospiraceae bacterium]|nr:toll/interleukin-1 receptor domain-containing protein [Oscillospiraceae bacterium]